MQVLKDLIEAFREKDHPVTEVLTGAYWTGVVSRHCGLASTFRDEGRPHARGVRDLGRLTEKSSWELAHYAFADYAMEASIGMAALNSMIAEVVDPAEAFRCISQGATFREIRGVRRITLMKK